MMSYMNRTTVHQGMVGTTRTGNKGRRECWVSAKIHTRAVAPCKQSACHVDFGNRYGLDDSE